MTPQEREALIAWRVEQLRLLAVETARIYARLRRCLVDHGIAI
jgi:hypothetical protein